MTTFFSLEHSNLATQKRRGQSILKLRTDSGLVIFSRLPVVETRSIRFESGAALDAGACKGAMWARCVVRNLDLLKCHVYFCGISCPLQSSIMHFPTSFTLRGLSLHLEDILMCSTATCKPPTPVQTGKSSNEFEDPKSRRRGQGLCISC